MHKETILVLVKTYPTLSKTYGELSCVAGIRKNGSWVRLYPIPFRRLKEEYRFEKYRWIELPIERNASDHRPESYRPVDLSQIKQLHSVDVTLEKVRQKYFDTFLSKTDLHFFLGTTRQWHNVAPNPFVIIGTFSPPKASQMYLDF